MREGSVLGDEDELEAVARELEEADRKDSTEEKPSEEAPGEEAPGEEDEREGMDNFRNWLKGMQDDPMDGEK